MNDDEWHAKYQPIYNAFGGWTNTSAGYFHIDEAIKAGLTPALMKEGLRRGAFRQIEDDV